MHLLRTELKLRADETTGVGVILRRSALSLPVRRTETKLAAHLPRYYL